MHFSDQPAQINTRHAMKKGDMPREKNVRILEIRGCKDPKSWQIEFGTPIA